MPVRIRKRGRCVEVRTPNRVHAKCTTRDKAQRQARLLRMVEHGGRARSRSKSNRRTGRR